MKTREDTARNRLNKLEVPIDAYRGKGLVTARQVGNLLFLSGYGADTYRQGRIGENLTIDDGYEACRYIAMRHIAALIDELGDLSRVDELLRAFGFINIAEGFTELDRVFDGYSDLMATVFGKRGVCPRTIMGTHSLPVGNTAAEIELILSIKP